MNRLVFARREVQIEIGDPGIATWFALRNPRPINASLTSAEAAYRETDGVITTRTRRVGIDRSSGRARLR